MCGYTTTVLNNKKLNAINYFMWIITLYTYRLNSHPAPDIKFVQLYFL